MQVGIKEEGMTLKWHRSGDLSLKIYVKTTQGVILPCRIKSHILHVFAIFHNCNLKPQNIHFAITFHQRQFYKMLGFCSLKDLPVIACHSKMSQTYQVIT